MNKIVRKRGRGRETEEGKGKEEGKQGIQNHNYRPRIFM